jgi:plastocyanin
MTPIRDPGRITTPDLSAGRTTTAPDAGKDPIMTSHRKLAAIGVALALSLAACADASPDDRVDDGAGETDADTDLDLDVDADLDLDADGAADVEENADAPAGDVVATDAVDLRNITFAPADIEVELGTTVTFTNLDIVRHTVTSGRAGDPDGLFDLDLSDQGAEATFTFDEPGTYHYYCDLHRTMVGSVTVTD